MLLLFFIKDILYSQLCTVSTEELYSTMLCRLLPVSGHHSALARLS